MSDVLSNGRTDLSGADDRTTLAHVRILEVINIGLCHDACILKGFEENLLSLVVNGRIVRVNLIVCGYTDAVTFCSQCDSSGIGNLFCSIGILLDKCLVQDLTYLLRFYRLLELHDVVTSTCEIDTWVKLVDEEADEDNNSCNTPNGKCLLVHTHEVHMGVLQHVT